MGRGSRRRPELGREGGSLRPPPPRVGRQATPESGRDSGRGRCAAPAPSPPRARAFPPRGPGSRGLRAPLLASPTRVAVLRAGRPPCGIRGSRPTAAPPRSALRPGQVRPGARVRPSGPRGRPGCACVSVGRPGPRRPAHPRFSFIQSRAPRVGTAPRAAAGEPRAPAPRSRRRACPGAGAAAAGPCAAPLVPFCCAVRRPRAPTRRTFLLLLLPLVSPASFLCACSRLVCCDICSHVIRCRY